MQTTIENLAATKQVAVVAKMNSEYYRVKGTVEIIESGKYLDICNQADKDYPTRIAILIRVEEVFDLDKVEPVE